MVLVSDLLVPLLWTFCVLEPVVALLVLVVVVIVVLVLDEFVFVLRIV